MDNMSPASQRIHRAFERGTNLGGVIGGTLSMALSVIIGLSFPKAPFALIFLATVCMSALLTYMGCTIGRHVAFRRELRKMFR